jgi:uncharacterized protein (TIGR02246 family)
MKSLLPFYLILLVVIYSCRKNSDMINEKDKEAIFNETEQFIEAWNKGDAKAAASHFTEDGIRVSAMGNVQLGRLQIEAGYDYLFRKGMPGAKAISEKGTVRLLTKEYALWEAGYKIENPGDSTLYKGHVVEVLKKENGRWLILEAHPKIFPQAK